MYKYITPEEGMSYKEYIEKILNNRSNERAADGYQEKHHIVPKCLGGTNDDENLIWLYAEEHYYAHKLLYLENPHNRAIAYGWHCLSTRKQVKLSPKEYKEVKEVYSESISGKNHPMYGRHHTEDAKEKISQAGKGRKDSEETKQKKRERLLKDNPAKNEDTKRKMSKNHADFHGSKNGQAKAVINLDTGQIYGSIAEAAKDTNIGSSNISANVTGRSKSANGVHWAYYNKKMEDKLNGSNDSKS